MSADGDGRIVVRPAQRDDVPLLHFFIKALAEYEHLSHEVVADEAGLAQALFGERPVAEAVIAEWDGTAAGFCLFFSTFSTFVGRAGIYVEDLFVVPEMRGRGIGKALLGHVARLAVERGCGRLEWSVLDWNRPAIEFYERAGARALDEWTMYRLAGDALVRFAGSVDD